MLRYFMVAFRTELKLWHIHNRRYINSTVNIPCKTQHIKIPDTCKISVYWEPEVYSEYCEYLEYSLHNIFCYPAI